LTASLQWFPSDAPGDYNKSGAVDAADYLTWCNALGATYNLKHYTVWRANFGQTASTGTGSLVASDSPPAAPEPATVMLLCSFLAAALLRHRCAASSDPVATPLI
jgi:hypothetical protein